MKECDKWKREVTMLKEEMSILHCGGSGSLDKIEVKLNQSKESKLDSSKESTITLKHKEGTPTSKKHSYKPLRMQSPF